MPRRKLAPHERRILINLKVTRQDRKLIQSLADANAGGNLSQWLRLAGTGQALALAPPPADRRPKAKRERLVDAENSLARPLFRFGRPVKIA